MTIVNGVWQKVQRRLDERQKHRLLQNFTNKKGIEIGGPSSIFCNDLPIYSVVGGLDGCNFSTDTVWEGSIAEGLNYNYYQDKIGFQYISEASDLNKIQSGIYDFVLASHCLEHCANTLGTVKEWLRIIKPGGYILLILPDKQYTFDHNREITSFEHLVEDYKNNVDETDLTHLNEILALHDLVLDSPAGDLNNFRQRSLNNYKNRCLHHHVFNFDLLKVIFSYFKIKVKFKKFIAPYHQIILGVKG